MPCGTGRPAAELRSCRCPDTAHGLILPVKTEPQRCGSRFAWDSGQFPESSEKWKLPDPIFYSTGREYQDVKINIDMSTIEINGEWYVLVAPNDDNYVIADVKDSVGTKFLEAENNKNEKICYGYMEHKPKDYWISVNGEKISLD